MPNSLTTPTFKRVMDADWLIAQLDEACAWAEITRGRATRYGKLIAESFAGKGDSQEHVLAFYEALEVAEIFQLWRTRVHEFTGLKEKIREAIMSGPLLREGEKPSSSSNRPRNDIF